MVGTGPLGIVPDGLYSTIDIEESEVRNNGFIYRRI